MAIHLDNDVKELLRDAETIKVVATTDEHGVPHAVIKQSLHLGDDGNLVYLELLESSRTNKNLLRSLWFNRKVSVALKGKEKKSYQIIGTAERVIITGPVFERYYLDLRKRLGDVDLAAVWIIKPEKVINQNFGLRRKQEEALHPVFNHLDRIARQAV